MVWGERRDAFALQSNNQDAFYNVSTDGGLTWRANSLPLNTATAGSNVNSDIDRIWLTASGDTFHCTWEEDSIAGAGGRPVNSFGFFVTSQSQGFTANPGGSSGNLCIAGSIGRYVAGGQIKNSGRAGESSLTPDLTQTPQPNGLVSITTGETWNFQAWHRDSSGGTTTSNFTIGLSLAFDGFCPFRMHARRTNRAGQAHKRRMNSGARVGASGARPARYHWLRITTRRGSGRSAPAAGSRWSWRRGSAQRGCRPAGSYRAAHRCPDRCLR
ncbi:MAG: hypothetical protein ACI80K_001201 [Paracoccaceae bacterium]